MYLRHDWCCLYRRKRQGLQVSIQARYVNNTIILKNHNFYKKETLYILQCTKKKFFVNTYDRFICFYKTILQYRPEK